MKFDENGWPLELFIPEEEHFCRGSWVEYGHVEICHVTPAQAAECGTRGCLVGLVGMAFGTGVTLQTFHSVPGREFLSAILEEIGAEDFYLVTAAEASSMYEFGQWSAADYVKAWKAAAKKKDYDLSHLKDWKP